MIDSAPHDSVPLQRCRDLRVIIDLHHLVCCTHCHNVIDAGAWHGDVVLVNGTPYRLCCTLSAALAAHPVSTATPIRTPGALSDATTIAGDVVR